MVVVREPLHRIPPITGGLVVANLILNSWDWKTSNNKIYQLMRARGRSDSDGLSFATLGRL